MRQYCRSFVVGLVSLSLSGLPLLSHAGAVSTQAFANNAPQERNAQAVVLEQMDRQDVRAAFVALGVSPEAVEQRLQNLSTSEIATLNARLANMPAGAGVVSIVGVVFIVLLVLELVGVTNIFTAF